MTKNRFRSIQHKRNITAIRLAKEGRDRRQRELSMLRVNLQQETDPEMREAYAARIRVLEGLK